MLRLMQYSKQKKVNVLYVGPDLTIADWLRQQSFVHRVLAIRFTDDHGKYSKFWGAAGRPNADPNVWLEFLFPEWNEPEPLPKWYQYTQTQVNFTWFRTREGMKSQLWHDGKLKQDAYAWARNALCERGLKRRILPGEPMLIHLHPVSTWSESAKNHWPHWIAAMEWMIANTPHTYLLTGQQEIPYLPECDRIVNMIGSTPTNMEVLALSEACDAVISTPNNVAIWSVIQRQRAFVIGNKATQYMTSYYRRFLQSGENLTWLNVTETYDAFTKSAAKWFAEDRSNG
jgi:flavin-binding protein dodecin